MDILLLMGIGLALLGAALAGWGALHHRKQGHRHADASARWHKTAGTVLDSRIVERSRSDNNDNDYTSYEPRLRYSYAIGTAAHEGERFNLCRPLSFADAARADQWLTLHAPGTAIDVWYDPASPADAACVIDKPSLFGAILTIAAGVGITLLGLWLLLNLG